MNNQNNLVSILALVVAVIALVMWLSWSFGGNSAPAPTAAVPTPTAVAPTAPAAAPAPVAPTTADEAKVNEFLETAYVKGNADAKVSVIEFSDVQCPFCQRHTNNGTLDQVAEKYGDDVNVIFAHYPLGFHANAQKAGEAIECAGEVGWEEGFFAMKTAYFAAGGDSNMTIARQAAEDAGLDADAVMDCVDAGTFAQKVKDQMAFGQSLGVTGTPGNIVLNNETLEFTKVSGAVPATSFDAPIASYLN